MREGGRVCCTPGFILYHSSDVVSWNSYNPPNVAKPKREAKDTAARDVLGELMPIVSLRTVHPVEASGPYWSVQSRTRVLINLRL
jgi:hypothetical protein